MVFFFFQAEDGIRVAQESRGLGDVYKRQPYINSLDTLVGTIAYRHYKYNFEKIPVPEIAPATEPIVHQIESLVDKILSAKKENPQADTSNLEKEIDRMVYKLYDLTEEEIKIVEGVSNEK